MHIGLVLSITVLTALCSQQTNSLACYLSLEPSAEDHLGYENSKHQSNPKKYRHKGANNNSNSSEDYTVSLVRESFVNGRIQINHTNRELIDGLGVEEVPVTVVNDEEDLISPLLLKNNSLSSKSDEKRSVNMFEDRARSDAYKKTEAAQHPYSVAILFLNNDDTVAVCTGTLLTPAWVLTAAHCVLDEERTLVSATVYAGTSVRVAPPTPPRLPQESQVIVAKRMHVHPKYDAKNVDYDLALIDVSPGFNRTEFVDTAKLSRERWTHEGYAECVITSFGRVQTGLTDSDDYMRKTQQLEVIKPCKFRSKKVGATRNICSKPKQDYGLCTGDSGGGLVCNGEVKAVASFIRPQEHNSGIRTPKNTGPCGDVDTLTAFHDIYYSLEWISSIVPLPKGDLVDHAKTKTSSDSNEPSKSTWTHSFHTKQLMCVIILIGLYL